MEKIDLTNGASQTLALTFPDIIDMTDGKHTLFSAGDTGDHVSLATSPQIGGGVLIHQQR